ncbi:MAG: GNAT family N-acetyltransferase [Paludibacteraceae bacterium]|nr:GNAT family N-acetyltransferase [Paludibacteraceae bacterium]
MSLPTPIYELYHSAFPAKERRPWAEIEMLLQNEKRFHIKSIEKEGRFCGFISSWSFGSFVYIEHFAVAKDMRSKGCGANILQQVCREANMPVVLEVEPPATTDAIRRIAFYERNGFEVLTGHYMQPPYDGKSFFLPMLLMCNHRQFGQKNYEKIRKTLYSEVYGQK